MAQAVAAMAGLCSATQAVLQGSSASSLVSSNGSQLKSTQCGHGRTSARRGDIQVVCSQNKEDLEVHTRRSMLGLLAATVGAGALAREARAEATPVEIKPPPPPFGGLREYLTSSCYVPLELAPVVIMHCRSPLSTSLSSIVFPFRFKQSSLHAPVSFLVRSHSTKL